VQLVDVLYAPIATKFRNVTGPKRLPVQRPTHDTLTPTRIEVFHYKAAIREPIVTSFGSIPARNALLIRIEDRDGAFGWGEVWANFPPSGAESKLRLLETVILPMSGRSYVDLERGIFYRKPIGK
jgi:L-alanine-DL-glutamate epimerase-like enolase superfamily enzyme